MEAVALTHTMPLATAISTTTSRFWTPDISRISLVPEAYYWARSSKHFDGKLTVVQVSTVFGEEPNYWTLALPGTDHDRNIAMLRNAGCGSPSTTSEPMTSMARAKGLKTTAEGVETDEQSDALVALG